jgi:Putative collagen-binding domain of a collagenase
MWRQSRYALEFFYKYQIEFWNMHRDSNRLPKGSVDWAMISQDGDYLVIYRRNSNGFGVYLNGLYGRFIVTWYNPRQGGSLQDGSVTTIPGGSSDIVDYGFPPDSVDKDWIILLKRASK